MQVIQGGKVRRGDSLQKRLVSITLPDREWELIDKMIQVGQYSSYDEYFQTLHEQGN